MDIKEIQKLSGYSYSTISRVLTGKAKEFRISDETARVIIEAAEKLNYRPNILARSLRLKKSTTIGLIVPDIQNPFFGAMKVVQKHEKKSKRYIMMSAFDIGPFCHLFKRPLVCANQDLRKLANLTVSLLMDKINNSPRKDNQLILPISIEKYRID